MAVPSAPFQETSIRGPRTRRWMLEAADCPQFDGYRIARVGVDSADAPYCRVRLRVGGSSFLACIEGHGRALLEGRWQRVGVGQVCLAPPRVTTAVVAVPGVQWGFVWMTYDEPHFVKPLVGADSPLHVRKGGEEIARAVLGLRAEWEGERDPSLLRHWVSLAHGLSRRLAYPWRSSSRVAEVWETVARELATDWKLTALAERCNMSVEHLRRLCLRELGRTPMEHLTHMRIRRAQELLERTEQKLELIAEQVGYQSATVFSRAFARCLRMTPSEYRARRC